MRVRAGLIAVMVLGFSVLGCTPKKGGKLDPEYNDYHDRHLGLSRNDYRNLDDPDAPEGETPPGKRAHNNPNENGRTLGGLGTGETAPDIKTSIVTKAPPIPTLSQILAVPQPPKIGATQLVSIAVTDDVPLKDVLIELARLADVDVELDAGITGGISFTANERPFNEVISRISDLAGLRYSMKGGVLRVERDLPYIRNYAVDFLNVVRDTKGSIGISTSVLSGAGSGSSGLNSGSLTEVKTESNSDMWSSLETGIKEILSYAPASHTAALASTVDEVAAAQAEQSSYNAAQAANKAGGAAGAAVPVPATPAAAPVASAEAAGGAGGGAAGGAATASAGGAAAGNKGVGPGSGHGAKDTFYIMNRQAGILTVSGNDKQHTLIETFLSKMRSSASAQVLIEAKIVEVSLNERFQTGIQWGLVNDRLGFSLGSIKGSSTLSGDNSNFAGVIGLGNSTSATGESIDNLLQLLDEFGTTRTLSSPRLHAINNQQAVLTFARNEVYFNITVSQSTTTSVGNVTNQSPFTVNSEVKTVPIGLILSMQPSINMETNEVTLNVRPTLSRIINTVPDPAVAFLLASAAGSTGSTPPNIANNIPVVEVRELDSILKLKSGDVMVIGGLMEQTAKNVENGVPFIADVPYFGNLFKHNDKQDTTSELVILIRATIVDSNGSMHETDRKLLNKFTRDPRPM